MKTLRLFLTIIALATIANCTKENDVPPLPEDFEEDIEITDPEDPETENFIHDSGFDETDLIKSITDEPLIYDTWVYSNSYPDDFSFELAYDGEQENVGKMICGTERNIPNSDPTRAFIAQRIRGTFEAGLYTLTFKAKSAEGNPTCRIFIRCTDESGALAKRYFIYETGKPSNPEGKYTAYCKNCPETPNTYLSTEEWMSFSYVIDLSKIVTETASVAYNTAENSTEIDRTDIVVCLQNNQKKSSMLVDDVTLSKLND